MITAACSKTYLGKCVLKAPPLSFEPGRIYAVMGANGSGKSTFAKLLAGILPPDSGEPVWERPVSVGYLPQRCYPFRMSLQANIRLSGAAMPEVQKMMQALQIDHLAKQHARCLSGGEAARMALGRVLVRPFELVILDEPTAAMDIESTMLSERVIRSYCAQNRAATILITHSISQAGRIADFILFFKAGALVEYGPVGTLLHEPTTEALRQFLQFF